MELADVVTKCQSGDDEAFETLYVKANDNSFEDIMTASKSPYRKPYKR